MAAQVFGGILLWDAWVALGENPHYRVHASLYQASLAECARDLAPGHENLNGTIRAEADVQGAGTNLNSLTGRGSIELEKADIYELPVMVSLLKILSVRKPDKTAFISSDADFRIEHGRMCFEHLNLNGDAVSLVGEGDLDFQGKIDLKFHSMVGRADRETRPVRDLFGGASQQFFQIRVGGTLQNPETSREAFPGVNQALQRLQPDREREKARSGGGATAVRKPAGGQTKSYIPEGELRR
jgi:hypothetical protein